MEEQQQQGGACDSDTVAPIHVLAVDDCFLDRKIVEKLLKNASFKVTSVDNGKKAMEILGLSQDKVDKSTYNDQKIDIILTDYCMPEMNGYDLLMAVKGHSNVKSIPVVIISSEYDPQRISRCLANGAEDFLQKPLQQKDLQKLRSYARPISPVPKTGTKRKVKMDLMPESGAAERRPRVAGVAVA
ncbi:two-component response regulator ORR3 [Ricinus communis]|uniref:Receptor histidine kinase, putative n=1 Tax=Ricinus communis TaxID=3988 RepID=B9SBU6_RICCO|nr:two-component response regulator ORR3 [Ricinus communis]EEF38924.1 receptor histidine kinase, putative [Ricinus communis]|eukprot:XP_002523465.1 two-component response regulator ORR3 [Ricinus communis]